MTNPFQVSREAGGNPQSGALVALAAAAAFGSALAAVGGALQSPEPAGSLETVSAQPTSPARLPGDAAPGLPRIVALQPPQPGLALSEIPTGAIEPPEPGLPARTPGLEAQAPAPAPVQPPLASQPSLPAQALAAREDPSPTREGAPASRRFAGVWAPTGEACVPRLNKRGLLPAVISSDGAYAGETSCSFAQGRRTGSGSWTFAAACTGPRGRWKTTVRLTTEGDRLTWSSKRGSQTYVRCGASDLMRAGIGRAASRMG